ncbi:conserved hypothetical protein [Gammaproteobacteria bacterium]
MSNVGGDKLVLNKEYVTAGANLADKTLVTVAGAVPANGAVAYGVVEKDTANGDLATVKTSPGIIEIVATGSVTKGGKVEALQGTVYGNIAGTSTAITAAGVQDLASGYPIGLAHTGTTTVGETVLVELFSNQAKTA